MKKLLHFAIAFNLIASMAFTASAIESWTVNFADHDGTNLKTEIVVNGNSATAPTEPIRTGYNFRKWNMDFSKITTDTTVTALYSYLLTANDIAFDAANNTITDYINTVEKNIEIPDSLNGVAVNIIGSLAFFEDSLESVIIPESIISIMIGGFAKNNLTSVNIPSKIDSIGDYAFLDNSITSLNIPENIAFIGKVAFNKNSIVTINDKTSNGIIYKRNNDRTIDSTTIVSYGGTSLVIDFIPSTVDSIGDDAFIESSLTSITIPNSVVAIGNYAFFVNSLTSVTIPNSVVAIGKYAFDKNLLTSISLPSDVIGLMNEYWENNDGVVVTSITDFEKSYSVKGDMIKHKVVFKDYDSSKLKTDSVVHNTKAIPPVSPIRTGYTFTGWDINYNNITSDTTITALYKINKYQVVFLNYNKDVLKADSVVYNTKAIPPVNPMRTGYTFTEWNVNFNSITSDTTITALYKINKYKVTFQDYDAYMLKADSIEYNSKAIPPAIPRRTGYTFTEWDINFNNITSDTIITALYKINKYQVVFQNYNQDVLKTDSVEYLSTAIAPEAPVRNGYEFTGWDKNYSIILSNLTITAQYSLMSGIENINTNNMKIFPNPAKTKVNIVGMQEQSITIINSAGIVVQSLYNISDKEEIDISDLSPGIYFVKTGKETIRLIIE